MRSPWIFGRLVIITLVISICCLYLLSFYLDLSIREIPMFREAFSKPSQIPTRLQNRTIKTILFWNTIFGNENFYFGQGDIFRDCPVSDCFATHDKYHHADLTDFDAILFHGVELTYHDLPTKRSPRQQYVFVSLESPENRPITEPIFENYFNLTMTYRLDSDVPWPYQIVRDMVSNKIVAPARYHLWDDVEDRNENALRMKGQTSQQALLVPADNSSIGVSSVSRGSSVPPAAPLPSSLSSSLSLPRIIRGKRKEVIWFVSNCAAKSGRDAYVEELSRHIRVDVYGKCSDRYACPRTRDCFREIVEPDYYFYLSFENTLCQDYVTEKLYNPLRYNVVPIVYGGANYNRFVPPGSYVNTLDFESPKDLAIYLKSVVRDTRKYLKYFRWKKRYRIEASNHHTVCNLCKLLHERRDPQTYNPLSYWYSKNKCPMQDWVQRSKSGYVTRSSFFNDP